jgi:hypothetical protein
LLTTMLATTGCGGGSFAPSSSNTSTPLPSNTVMVVAKSATGSHTLTIFLTPPSGHVGHRH